MLKYIFSFLLVSVVTISATSQDKLAIDDRTGIIGEDLEKLISEGLANDNITYTNMVDYKERCSYYYATLENSGDDVIIKIEDCNSRSAGSKNLGRRLPALSTEEQSILLKYAILDIITDPGKHQELALSEGPVQAEEDATDVQDATEAVTGDHNSRYFFAPSAYNLKQGVLYYNTIYFLLHDIQYGVSDQFSIGMGTSVIGLPFYLTPKVSFPIGERSALALGDLLILGTYGTDAIGNLVYGSYSRGGANGNMSFGLGHLAINENEITGKTSSAVLNLSGMTRISPYIYVMTENYLMNVNVSHTAGIYAWNDVTYEEIHLEETFAQRNYIWYGVLGFRIVHKKMDYVSWQIGLTYLMYLPQDIPLEYESWSHSAPTQFNLIAFPAISYTRKFGKMY